MLRTALTKAAETLGLQEILVRQLGSIKVLFSNGKFWKLSENHETTRGNATSNWATKMP